MRHRLLLLCFVVSSCYLSDELPPDQDIWEYGRPKDLGLVEDSLLNIVAAINAERFERINGMIIIKDDQLIFEDYYNAFVRPTQMNIGRGTLAFTLAAIGVAVDERLLTLDDPIANYLPNYEQVFEDHPDKNAITIRHLLIHRSGLAWNESIFSTLNPENDVFQMKTVDDWVRFVLEKPLEAPPGLRFSINTASGLVLAKVVEEATGQDYETYLRTRILRPLTIEHIDFERDPNGNINGGDGLRISLLDWTKLNYLYLNGGLWEGRKILDANFVEDAILVQSEVSARYSSGYYWRQFGSGFEGSFGLNHEDIYFIAGELGQHSYIIPSENMIVSIFAENFFFGFFNPSLQLFRRVSYSFQ